VAVAVVPCVRGLPGDLIENNSDHGRIRLGELFRSALQFSAPGLAGRHHQKGAIRVADPMGGPPQGYPVTADLLDQMISRLVELGWGQIRPCAPRRSGSG
jgi:hypothetical protein